jgi:hypothetical protein
MPSGLAVGPEVDWQNAGDTVRANLTAVGSVRQFYSVGTGLELPRLTRRHLDLTLKAGHSYMPQLDFYGEGPNSVKGHGRYERLFRSGLARIKARQRSL